MVGPMASVAVIAPPSPIVPAIVARLRSAGWAVRLLDWPAVDAAELKTQAEGVDAVVNLALDPDATRAALDAAASVAASTVVQLSTAAVYGAWPDNPAPLTETEPMRPNPGTPGVAGAAEAERLTAEWSDGHPSATVAVLRPAVTLSAGQPAWPSSLLAGVDGLRSGDAARRVQFVHVDDVAAAVVLAAEGRLDGTFNVAPDGWLTEEAARAVAGTPTRLAWPRPLARLRRARPGDAYRRFGWVVANDKLKAAGWEPTATNEEALVLTRQPTLVQRIPPSRKQELTLGATAVLTLGVVGAVVAVVRRRARNR